MYLFRFTFSYITINILQHIQKYDLELILDLQIDFK